MRCYKSFISVSKYKLLKCDDANCNNPIPTFTSTLTLRNTTQSIIKSHSRVLPKVCKFCKNPYKRKLLTGFEKLKTAMSPTAQEELKGIIRNDEKMWIEYGEIDFVAKEVKCKHEYTPSEKQSSSTIDSFFAGVYAHITESVIQNQRLVSIVNVYNQFKSSYQRTVFDVKSEIPAKRTVLTKVYTHFGDTIKNLSH